MENKKEGFCQICIAQSKTDLSAAVIPQYGYVYCSSPYPLILVSLNLVVLFDSEEKKEDISIPTTSGQACAIDWQQMTRRPLPTFDMIVKTDSKKVGSLIWTGLGTLIVLWYNIFKFRAWSLMDHAAEDLKRAGKI